VGVKVIVRVGVTDAVAVSVAMGGSDVAVVVGGGASVGVDVTVGVSGGGVFLGMNIKAKRSASPISPGIPYLT